MTKTGSCRYRGDSGCKCIIGQLIDDSAYSTKLENEEVSSINVKEALVKSGIKFNKGDTDFLVLMQYLHDRAAHMASLKRVSFFHIFARNIKTFKNIKLFPEVQAALNSRLGLEV
ncbi:MAG: hypothetical protein E2O80_01970 [Betaproteobacteria bacterium]|nr:MAG: hypothetical protein E2O80_01970 [Betaproteobacteria bacterium]